MSGLTIDPRYGGTDADTRMFLDLLEERPPCRVLEVGANQEWSCRILADNGFDVTGVDLNPHDEILPHNYRRIEGDFVPLAENGELGSDYDVVFSTSAIEHFGLFTYNKGGVDPFYDQKAIALMYDLLKPGGTCHITVPYGKDFVVHGRDWRIYNREELQKRIIQNFVVEDERFFKSAGANCEEIGVANGVPQVARAAADQYTGDPHVTVYLKMRKVK